MDLGESESLFEPMNVSPSFSLLSFPSDIDSPACQPFSSPDPLPCISTLPAYVISLFLQVDPNPSPFGQTLEISE
jgi:hypothetical protein